MIGFAGEVDRRFGLIGEDEQAQRRAAFGQTPQTVKERTAVVEVVGQKDVALFAAHRRHHAVETRAVAAIADGEQTAELSGVRRQGDDVGSSLQPVVLRGRGSHFGLALDDGAQGADIVLLAELERSGCSLDGFGEEEMLGLLGCQQIDVIHDGFVRPFGLEALQDASVGKAQRRGHAGNLHEVETAAPLGHNLSGGVADAGHVDGEDCHATLGQRELRQAHAAGLQLDAALGFELGQTLVVVDEDEGAAAVGAHRPAQPRILAPLEVLRTGERRRHGRQQCAEVLHEEVERSQAVVLRISLTELAQRRLEVVGEQREVVVGSEG